MRKGRNHIIEDHSTNGTKAAVKGFLHRGRVFMMEPSLKPGLGSACVKGFKRGRARGCQALFEKVNQRIQRRKEGA